jgi:hypothetical protein
VERVNGYALVSKKGLTPHHHIDGKTIQLVNKEVHDAFPHTGGASILREQLK